MNQKLREKIMESLSAVLPITGIVLFISIFLVPVDLGTMVLFLVGAILLVIGMGFFQLGAEMEAAKPMGATGGTVFHSRRAGGEGSKKFFGISVQQEREVVLILARKEDRRGIMQAISKKCGIQSHAQGIVMSMPVDGTAGMD